MDGASPHCLVGVSLLDSSRDLLHQEYRVWSQRPIWGLDPKMRKPTLATQILAINALLIVATAAPAIPAARLSLDDVAGRPQPSLPAPPILPLLPHTTVALP